MRATNLVTAASGRLGQVAVAIAVLATLVTAVPPAASAEACAKPLSDQATIVRISGPDRFATAACGSLVRFPDGTSTVLIARGDGASGFPDALAGTPLAHALTAPILLSQQSQLPAVTRAEIQRLGATRIRVLGGPASVSDGVLAELRRLAPDVARIAGADRYATAAMIAGQLGGTTAFLVDGTRSPDALTAGAAAARSGAALLLTEPGELPAVTRDALDGRTAVTIVGGDNSVSPAVEAALRGLDLEVDRLSGPDRQETAASVARAHPGQGTIHLVGGADAYLVDALAAGWLAARSGGGPVLYANQTSIGRGTDRYLRLGPLVGDPETWIIGGPVPVADEVATELEAHYEETRAGGPKAEVRGLWVHLFDPSLKSREGIREVLDTAASANMNTIVVQVARRHDAFYESDVLPQTTDEGWPADLDLLAELVPAAHARGLQVHAWYSVMPSIHTSMLDETLPDDHVHTLHGPGTADSWMAAVSYPNYDFMDPAIPGVQSHVTSMIAEVVERYDVDGVHLDYLRYEGIAGDQDPPRDEHPTTMQRYDDHRLPGESLADFLRAQTQDLARRIYVEVADADPTVVVSAALIAQAGGPTGDDLRASFETTKAYAVKAQDWRSWIDEGIVDHAYPMTYFRQSDATQAQWFDQWATFADEMDSGGHVTALGQASYLNCPAQSVEQIARAQRDVDGVVLFSFQGDAVPASSTEGSARCPSVQPGDLFRSLAAGPFATPAPVPPVVRKVAPTAGHAAVSAADGTVVTFTRNGTTRQVRTDATGVATAVWLAPGTWQVTAPGYAPTSITVSAGAVTRKAMLSP
jgi:uncharacterized lipoprotein YddW (UPF0748 family)/putative cell wall-binding protein